MMLDLFARVKAQLVRHEGFRRYPYKDTVGKLTIGFGRNLEDQGITRDEADYLLENDIFRAVNACRAHIAVFSSLTEARQEVLVNMTFNMGLGNESKGLLSFKKMLAALKRADYEEAAKQMLDSKWARQVGVRAHELAEQMRAG